VGEGVVARVDSDSVATGKIAVVDSSGVVVALAVALVTAADSAVPDPVDETPEADEPVELTEEASASDDAVLVADASPVAEDCRADVTSPDPPAVVSVLLGLVTIGTIGMMVLSLEVVAGSLELPEAMVDGLSVG
jgi:hypothetical protein